MHQQVTQVDLVPNFEDVFNDRFRFDDAVSRVVQEGLPQIYIHSARVSHGSEVTMFNFGNNPNDLVVFAQRDQIMSPVTEIAVASVEQMTNTTWIVPYPTKNSGAFFVEVQKDANEISGDLSRDKVISHLETARRTCIRMSELVSREDNFELDRLREVGKVITNILGDFESLDPSSRYGIGRGIYAGINQITSHPELRENLQKWLGLLGQVEVSEPFADEYREAIVKVELQLNSPVPLHIGAPPADWQGLVVRKWPHENKLVMFSRSLLFEDFEITSSSPQNVSSVQFNVPLLFNPGSLRRMEFSHTYLEARPELLKREVGRFIMELSNGVAVE